MDIDFLHNWKDQLESRSDLMCLHKNKKLDVCLIHETKKSWVSFHSGTIAVNDNSRNQPDLIITTNDEILYELLSGTKKLSLVPNDLIQITGRFKDVLFLESILYLT